MNASSRRLVTCLVVGAAGLVGLVGLAPTQAGAAPQPRAQAAQRQAAARTAADPTPHLTYYDGRVLSHVKVDLVVWDRWTYSPSVPLTGTRSVSSFFTGITASKYLDWLSEYDAPRQHIGRGTLEGVYTVRPPNSANGATVSADQIGRALRRLIDAGQLPKPTTNRVFVIFFRSGQTIVTPGGNSRDDFCAYHDTMTYKSSTAYYAVMPYEVGNRGCRMASTSFNSVTTVVSHELVEAITDPGVGLNRVAWYDPNYGEAGDICAGTSARVVGGDGVSYTVQRIWSNRAGACIATR